jgi:multidrug resistance efflux pump
MSEQSKPSRQKNYITFVDPGKASSARDQTGLAPLKFDDYIPSIRPWMSYSSLFLVLGFLSSIAFMAVFPYRVVVRGTGTIRPTGELSVINSPYEGRLRKIHVTTNQVIEAGQIVVTLDQADMQGKLQELDRSILQIQKQSQSLLAQSKAEYEVALSEVEKNKAQLKLAESEFKRFQSLKDIGAASVQQVEEREAAFNIAKATLDKSIKSLDESRSRSANLEAQLQRELVSHEANASKVRRDLRQSQVRAPVRGSIYRLDVRSPGQTISVGQPIASIAPSQSALIVKAMVRGEDIANVKVGQSATLRIFGCPHPDFGVLKAKVTSIAPDAFASDQNQGSSSGSADKNDQTDGYEVRLIPEKTILYSATRQCRLKIGMDLTADIATRNEPILLFLLRKARIITSG